MTGMLDTGNEQVSGQFDTGNDQVSVMFDTGNDQVSVMFDTGKTTKSVGSLTLETTKSTETTKSVGFLTLDQVTGLYVVLLSVDLIFLHFSRNLSSCYRQRLCRSHFSVGYTCVSVTLSYRPHMSITQR